ncbi:S49 family peptidase [Brevundimonas sp.]|uniref:S49 family peptidase n=1 Tax=Brevundimonas sp. TaxID=1871086 RepID=UPI002D42FB63|nr:S49 family peptidase [Brevundimonas sp.]HYD29200.1 S49 family peptidase [Brevundimonas sp.]
MGEQRPDPEADAMAPRHHDATAPIIAGDVATLAARAVASVPWLIAPEWLPTILAIANRSGEAPEAVAARLGRRLENTHRVTERNGVAIVSTIGPIFRYANMFTEVSGATSLAVLARDFMAAADNPDVKAIILEQDTPGGMAAGIGEFAEMVHRTRARKRVVSYVSNMSASAGYWIGAACSEIVLAATAEVGSIGTVQVWTDTRERDSRDGVKTIEIVSSQSPEKRPDITTDEGRGVVQARVDHLTEIFIGAVARYRAGAMDEAAVRAIRGGMRIGTDAVTAGLADRLGNFEDLLAELSAARPPSRTGRAAAAADVQQQGTQTMDKDTLLKDHPDVAAAVRADGAAAERARIGAILALKRPKGHEDLIGKAIEDGKTTAAEVGAAILAAEMEKGPRVLEQLRTDEQEAKDKGTAPAAPRSAAPASDVDASTLPLEERAKLAWDKDADLRAEFGGKFEAYLAYEKAAEGGRFKVLGAR